MASTTTKLYLGSTLLVDLTAFALASSLTAHADNGSIHVTDGERSSWNAKLDASALASYVQSSTLTTTLASYATQDWVTQQIAAKSHIRITPVETLPAEGVPDVIYLVPPAGAGDSHLREQYVYLNGEWIKVGDTGVSLDGYAAESWVKGQLEPYAKSSDVTDSIATAKEEAVSEAATHAEGIYAKITSITQSAYNALAAKDIHTLYAITD